MEEKRKILLLGTGAGVSRAPINDISFERWGLSGHWNSGQSFERVYEVHSPEALTKMNIEKPKGDWMFNNITHINPRLNKCFPEALEIDFEGLIEKYGRIFNCSFSWMLADAIEEGVDEIHIYGVTLNSKEEYAHQKPSVARLVGRAEQAGIKVVIDKECELMSSPFMYGYEEAPEFITALADKKKRVLNELERAEAAVFDAKARFHHLEGVKDEIEWFENNYWSYSRKQ